MTKFRQYLVTFTSGHSSMQEAVDEYEAIQKAAADTGNDISDLVEIKVLVPPPEKSMIAKVMWYELATILVLALIVGADALRGNWNAAAAVIAFAIVAGAGPLVLLLLGDIVTRKQNAQLVQPRG